MHEQSQHFSFERPESSYVHPNSRSNISALVRVLPSKKVMRNRPCLSLKPKRWWGISNPEAESEDGKMPSNGYKLLLASPAADVVAHASITVSLSLSNGHTFWMCRGNAAAGFYVPSWLHHSSHHLSRAHPLWTAISFSGNPAENEPMEKKRQKGRSCFRMFSITCIYHLLESNEANHNTHSFIHIYVFGLSNGKMLDEQNESEIYNLSENSVSTSC
jgi:hypothetical protein